MKVLKKLCQQGASVLSAVQKVISARCRTPRLQGRTTDADERDRVEADEMPWQRFTNAAVADFETIVSPEVEVCPDSFVPKESATNIKEDSHGKEEIGARYDGPVYGGSNDCLSENTVIDPPVSQSLRTAATAASKEDTRTSSSPICCWESWDRGGIDDSFADGDPLWLADGRTPSSCCSLEDLDSDPDTAAVQLYDSSERQPSRSNSALSTAASGIDDRAKEHRRYLAPRMSERNGVGILLQKRGINPPRVPYPLHSEMRSMFAQPFDVPPNDQLEEKLPDLYAAPVYEGMIRPFIKYDYDTMEYCYDSDNDPEDDMDVLKVSVPPGYGMFELTDDIQKAPPAMKREVYNFVRMSL